MPATLVRQEDVEEARREVARLTSDHESALEQAQASLTKMREANGGRLAADGPTREAVQELFADADKIGAELDSAKDHLTDLQARAYGRDPEDRMPSREARRRGHSDDDVAAAGLMSLSAALLDSDVFQAAADQPRRLVGQQLNIPLADVDATRAMLSPAQAAAGLVDVVGDDFTRLFPPIGIPTQAPRYLDLISVTATDRDIVVYGVQVDEDGNVTGAPPGTAFGRTTVDTERRTEEIRRRGTLMDVWEDVLKDEPRMRSWLDPRLRRLVRLLAEQQALYGDGTGQNYTGLFEWDGVGERQRASGQSIPDAIHQAMTDVRIAYHDEPDAVGFRPETWHELVTERSTQDGHYVNTGGPFGPMPTSVWGKQAYTSTLFRDGSGSNPLDCVVGYHPEAELVVREGIELREFEQNNDNAEKGLITLRVQHRSCHIVNQPVAFVLLDLIEAS